MGQAFSDFFSVTAYDAAKQAWTAVVHGVNTFVNWLCQEVKSFVSTVIEGIKDMVKSVKDFFINLWDKVEEFSLRVCNLKPTLKDYVYDKAWDIAEGMRNSGLKRMRDRLIELGINTDGMSDEEVVKIWKEYMAKNPLTPEQEKELDDALNPKKTDGKGGANLYAMAPTLSAGANVYARPTQHSAVSPHLRDHAITRTTFFFLYPEEHNIKPRKRVSLSPHEEQELMLALTAH